MTDTTPLELLRARLTDGRAAVGVAGRGYVRLLPAVERSDVTSAAGCVAIHTGHETVDHEWRVAHARLAVDTRTATRDVGVDRIGVVRF